jgi:hypothetical protein
MTSQCTVHVRSLIEQKWGLGRKLFVKRRYLLVLAIGELEANLYISKFEIFSTNSGKYECESRRGENCLNNLHLPHDSRLKDRFRNW